MTAPWPPEVEEWFGARTLFDPGSDVDSLATAKADSGLVVTVCLPALNEHATIGPICRSIHDDLVSTGVVDELLVLDSGSTDATRESADAAGAVVHSAASILPAGMDDDAGGKGDAIWKSLAVSSGDVIVWIDSDIESFTSAFVAGLLAPLLADPTLVMTKAFYERPLVAPDVPTDLRGGRVTELAARPLLRLLYPRLSAVIQPLSGEYALRRHAAMELPFVTGYGVDVALLIDVVERFGLPALAQVNLGRRIHRNRDLLDLGATSFQVMQAILLRLADADGIQPTVDPPTTLVQFDSTGAPVLSGLGMRVRPPMSSVLVSAAPKRA